MWWCWTLILGLEKNEKSSYIWFKGKEEELDVDYFDEFKKSFWKYKAKTIIDYKDVSFPQWLIALILMVIFNLPDFCS